MQKPTQNRSYAVSKDERNGEGQMEVTVDNGLE